MAQLARARERNEYRQHRPEQTLLYRLVGEHLESFLREAKLHYAKGLPRYVEREFRKYLECGMHAFGFLRARCRACGEELLVAFSCKRRGVCPSCNARRMCGTAAHLTDRVLPAVPVRQWVLSVPFELRLLLARTPRALFAVGRLFIREVFRLQRARARALGIAHSRSGALCFVQRFGGSLNLNVHYHVAIPDGVFVRSRGQTGAQPRGAHFERLAPPTHDELSDLAEAVAARVTAWLARQGLLRSEQADHDDAIASRESTALEACLAGSLGIGELVTLRPVSGSMTDVAPPKAKRAPRPAELRGFDIHAGVVVSESDTEGRERLLRYCARPPLSLERLQLLPNGQVVYALRKPWGKKTHRVLAPLDFLARLAALIPPPRHPLLTFHGVFAPHSAWRREIVPFGAGPRALDESSCDTGAEQAERVARITTTSREASSGRAACAERSPQPPEASPAPHRAFSARIDWAELLKRTYDVDALACSCGGRLSFIATILEPSAARAILASLDLPSEPPPIARARSPDHLDLDYALDELPAW